MKKHLSFTAVCLLCLNAFVFVACSSSDKKSRPTTTSASTTTVAALTAEPGLDTEVIANGLTNPWDIQFFPDNTLVFSERLGTISILKEDDVVKLFDVPDVRSAGEGGLMGIAVDSDFENNHYLFACFNYDGDDARDIRVVRYTIKSDYSGFEKAVPIITGIESNDGGRHSGCRLRSAQDGSLFIGTGDAARASNPQDPQSLNGKVLHVNRNGKGVQGNLEGDFDNRIFSYGHRNVQGIVLFDVPVNDAYGFSIEHGSDRDDEINLLVPGNFGWAPTGSYDESVPMTDLEKFPEAISSVWSSGDPTIAPSGATLIHGSQWGTYNGAIAMAVLKGERVKIIKFNEDNEITFEKNVLTNFGRIRSTIQGPDGNLYLTTDDDTSGKIVKVTPVSN